MSKAFSTPTSGAGKPRSPNGRSAGVTTKNTDNYVIVGGGTMGTILVSALLKFVPAEQITVLERTPAHAEKLTNDYGVRAFTVSVYDCTSTAVVILAVKPQDCAVLPTLLGSTASHSLIISVMAGITLAQLNNLTKAMRIARCLPNTPAKIGVGLTVWTATNNLLADDARRVEKIFGALGRLMKVTTDDWIDKATAISGSGPAYLYFFINAWLAAAQALGFTEEQAIELVRTTASGTIQLWQQSGQSAAALQQQVTSKGGTTAAALAVLNRYDMRAQMQQAVTAAYQRAKNLSADLQPPL